MLVSIAKESGKVEGLKIDVRRKQIQEILVREGKVRVAQFSKQLGTSEVTIRNDLAELEKSGYLERVPGGAVLSMKNYYNMDFQQRKMERTAEKQAIVRAAAAIVRDGDTLMINSGTTTYFMATELKRYKNLNIVTNSIYVAMELGLHPTFRVILLGGEINTQYSFLYGNDALKQLGKYKADKGILAVDGISVESGITTYHAEETEINRMMIERSHQTIIVADYTKVGFESFSRIGDISGIDICVTNKNASQSVLDDIAGNGVEIITC
jgi:DeoR/GlpR family transcriptional regulator of sugar metabolism